MSPGGFPEQLNLGPEGCGLCAQGCRSDQDDRARQQCVGLDDHAIPAPALLGPVPRGGRNSQVSPRSTHTLHEFGNFEHFLAVVLVCFQRCFGCHRSTAVGRSKAVGVKPRRLRRATGRGT